MSAATIAPALGRIPSGLFIVTFSNGDIEAAILGSWIQQCSFDPPMISMAIRKGRDIGDWLTDGVPFTVNVLAEGQRDLLAHFGRGLPLCELPNVAERVLRPIGGAVVLKEALAALHCRVAGRCLTGDHHLIFGQIVAGSLHSEERPYVHVRKNGLNY